MSRATSTIALLSPLLILVPEVFADNSVPNAESSTTRQTTVRFSEALESQAQRWSLTADEYQTYLALLNGPLGKWNPNIDPLLALGMYATSPEQSKRYAELYARQEHDLTQRTLAFQRLYQQAFNRLYPNQGLIHSKLLTPYFQHRQQKSERQWHHQKAKSQLQAGDRLLTFVSKDCNDCQTKITRLMGLISTTRDTRIDLYLVGVQGDAVVRRWVQAHQIDSQWIESQRLTLNKDEGLYQRLRQRTGSKTQSSFSVFLKRSDQIYQLKNQALGL
ncbi:TIGR03759 family integrating conjugative element protein [Porticoccus sp. GXU_MW_L64]